MALMRAAVCIIALISIHYGESRLISGRLDISREPSSAKRPTLSYFSTLSSCLHSNQQTIPPNDDSCKDQTLGKRHVILTRGGFIDQGIKQASFLSFPAIKAGLQVLLSIFNVICWILPLQSKHFTQNSEWLSLANTFAGGIFLMLSFGHLIPEAMSVMASTGKRPTLGLDFAIAGFLMMFFIEKVAFNHDPNAVVANGTGERKGLNSAMLLCLAMTFHSFFESAALGIATDISSAVMMATSIALHQPAESIALLVAFLKTDMSATNIIVWLTCFSLVGIVGAAAGIFVSSVANPYTEAVVLSVTAGTFIYVGATEVLCNKSF